MNDSAIASLKTHFSTLSDPRAQQSIEHKLIDIIIITICAVICGANSWVDVEHYGKSKQPWLGTFLALPNGIPSHDTFERLFAVLKPEELQQCFLNWVQAVHPIITGLIAIDGKTLRGAYERGGRTSMIHMVSAWASSNRLVLGQRKVEEKSNEITAIPELLKLLDLKGAVVTIDAMGTQKQIAHQIVAQQGDYVLALKGNQGNLHEDVKQLFESALAQQFKGIDHEYHVTFDRGHGRWEQRRYWVMGQTQYLLGAEQWAGLSSIGCVEAERHSKGKTTIERRYYILSLPPDAPRFAEAVRAHWSIENQLHWILDVAFREDEARACRGHGAENLSVIRHLAVNLLSQEKTSKGGIQAKRLRAGWDDDYLQKVLVLGAAASTI